MQVYQVNCTQSDINTYGNNFNNGNIFNTTPTFIEVQNNAKEIIYFCYATYDSYHGWQSIGWYEVVPHSNSSVNIGYYTGNIYLYAESLGGELTWADMKSPYTFCVNKTKVFSLPNADSRDCSGADYKRVRMSEFYVTSDGFVWTLSP